MNMDRRLSLAAGDVVAVRGLVAAVDVDGLAGHVAGHQPPGGNRDEN